MKTNRWLLVSVAVIGLTGLSACKNAIIGEWRAVEDDGCGKTRFTMDDAETGDGTMYVMGGTGCITCPFDVDANDRDDGRYTGTIQLHGCDCNGSTSFGFECFMNDDEDRMDCTMESACTPGVEEYVKID
jgi:hypothetical protein